MKFPISKKIVIIYLRQTFTLLRYTLHVHDRINYCFILDEVKRKEAMEKFITVKSIRGEQSYEFLNKIFNTVTQTYKQKPIVIDANDLQRNPGNFFKFLFFFKIYKTASRKAMCRAWLILPCMRNILKSIDKKNYSEFR